MAVTYQKGGSTDTWAFAGNVTVGGVAGVALGAATLAPYSSAGSVYTNAFSVGTRTTPHVVTMVGAIGKESWEPIQLVAAIDGANPNATTTVNMIYQNLQHTLHDMAALRLKNADWTVDVRKNLLDAYCLQGEIDFSTNAVAVGGEAAVVGLVMNAGSAGVTGALRGAIISMQGTVTSGSAYGLEIRGTMTTSSGVYAAIKTNGTPIASYDYGIIFGEESANNQGPTNLFWVPDGSSGDLGPVINNALVPAAAPDAGTMGADACIRIVVNATPYYIPLYNTLHA